MRRLLKTNGEVIDLQKALSIKEIARIIDAQSLDSFSLADGEHIAFVDDLGHNKFLPLNIEATRLYWERCGREVAHAILGDAVVALISDFE